MIDTVPARYPGAFRRVYPGFLQLAGFLSMNLDRHVRRIGRCSAIWPRATATAPRRRAPSMTSTRRSWICRPISICRRSQRVFQRARSGARPLPGARRTGGSRRDRADRADDGRGRARRYLRGRPDRRGAYRCAATCRRDQEAHHVQPEVGHYGVFHGRRWQTETYPQGAATSSSPTPDCHCGERGDEAISPVGTEREECHAVAQQGRHHLRGDRVDPHPDDEPLSAADPGRDRARRDRRGRGRRGDPASACARSEGRPADARSRGVHAVPAADQAGDRRGRQHHDRRRPRHDPRGAAGGAAARQARDVLAATWAR